MALLEFQLHQASTDLRKEKIIWLLLAGFLLIPAAQGQFPKQIQPKRLLHLALQLIDLLFELPGQPMLDQIDLRDVHAQ